jgi:hypothetical protein
MRKIAQLGMSVCEQIASTETVEADTDRMTMYSDLAAQSVTFNTSDLVDTPPE